MITLDLHHLFKTDPNNSQIPKVVYDWLMERNEKYPIEYKISFQPYRNEEQKQASLVYAQYFTGGLQVMNVMFPLMDGVWSVRLIGGKLEDGTLIPFADIDNPKHANFKPLGRERLVISGLLDLLEMENSPVEIVGDGPKAFRGIKRTEPLTETEMVAVKFDRNTNDEWEFRGTFDELFSAPEYKDNVKVNMLRGMVAEQEDEKSSS